MVLQEYAGFTLLELLVVLVIIGLLASYVGPRYFAQVGKSEAKVAKAEIDAFEKALAQYRLDAGHFPSTEQGLEALNTKPAGEPKWSGPYLSKFDCLGSKRSSNLVSQCQPIFFNLHVAWTRNAPLQGKWVQMNSGALSRVARDLCHKLHAFF